MRLTVPADVLRSVLAVCTQCLPPRTTEKINQCVVLQADCKGKEFCVLYYYDGSACRWYVPNTDIERSGSVVIDPSRLASVLGELEGEVKLEGVDGEKLVVSTLFSEFFLDVAHESEEYPSADLPSVLAPPFLTVDRQAFLDAIDMHRSSCAKASNVRYALQGVTLWPVVSSGSCKSLDVVATDGKVLTRSTLACRSEGKIKERSRQAPAMVLNRMIPLVLKMFADDPAEEVCLALDANAVVIRTARSVVRCQLNEGTYVDYNDVLSAVGTPDVEFEVVATDLLHCARLASICSSDDKFVLVKLGEGVLVAESHVSVGELVMGKSSCEIPIGVDGGGKEFLLSTVPFLGTSRVFQDGDMIGFRVNLKKHVASFCCNDRNLMGILALPERKN